MPRKIATTVYIEQRQAEQLALLSAAMDRPVAELIREGVDSVLERHSDREIVLRLGPQVELEFS